MKKNLKNFKEISCRVFDQNLYGNLTFFIFFTKYFLDFCLSDSLDRWKITPDLYNNFSDFGRGAPAFTTDATDQLPSTFAASGFSSADISS